MRPDKAMPTLLLLAFGLVTSILHCDAHAQGIQPQPATHTTPTEKQDGVVGATDPELGTLTGRFVFDGKLPPRVSVTVGGGGPLIPREPERLIVNGRSIPNPDHSTGRYTVVKDHPSLVVGKDGGIANLVIWVRSRNIPIPERREQNEKLVLSHKDGKFQPRVVAFRPPQTIVLRNEDEDKSQDFYRYGLKNEQFNVQVPPRKSIDDQIDSAERWPLPVASRFGGLRKSWLFACEHPYFAVSSKDGTFTIANLPVGKWEFQVWHERGGSDEWDKWPHRRFTMKIESGRNDLGTLELTRKMLDAL